MKKLHLIASLSLAFTAYAESSCDSYIGQIVSPITFGEAYEKVTAPSPKGEFETTEAYLSRTSSIQTPSKLIIARKADMKSGSYDGVDLIFYNADRNILKISEFAFHNMNIGAHLISKYNTPDIDFDFDSIYYHSIPFSENKRSSENYSASNSYGATVEVQRDFVDAELLIDPRKVGIMVPLFKKMYPYNSTSKENKYVIGEVKVNPEEAKSIKEAASLAFVVHPTKPYKFQKKYTFPEAKITSPYEKKYNTAVLVATMECGLWLDPKNRVIGAYPINLEKES